MPGAQVLLKVYPQIFQNLFKSGKGKLREKNLPDSPHRLSCGFHSGVTCSKHWSSISFSPKKLSKKTAAARRAVEFSYFKLFHECFYTLNNCSDAGFYSFFH